MLTVYQCRQSFGSLVTLVLCFRCYNLGKANEQQWRGAVGYACVYIEHYMVAAAVLCSIAYGLFLHEP